uniref:Inactivated thioredoxin/glutaredoxin n=1 Tax=Marseillevirus LCMAC102 TaxID=2506603 RepID=A0A481YU28_9VIRU|nr:MAG: inactivated thioredoxin/glutaredoxin [Marseillevirus LCMAC102]
MSINDVILFVSSTSPASAPCIQFVQSYQLPVRFVRLDTIADREAARNGKYFQITVVPTLLVTYSDANVQLFVGQEKILMWLKQVMNSRNKKTQQHIEESDEIEDEPPIRQKKKSKRDGLYDGVPKKSKKKKKVQKKPVHFEEESESDESEIQFIDNDKPPGRPPPPPTQGLMVGPHSSSKKKGQMTSVFDTAKQMEHQRQSTLGYKDEDLPVST